MQTVNNCQPSVCSTRPNRRLRYDHELLLGLLRLEWHRAGFVPVLFAWQIVSCRAKRSYIVHHLHHLLCSAGFSARAAAVHRLHGGSHYNSVEAIRSITACIRRRHAVVPALSSWRHSVSSHALSWNGADQGRWMSETATSSTPTKPNYRGSDRDSLHQHDFCLPGKKR